MASALKAHHAPWLPLLIYAFIGLPMVLAVLVRSNWPAHDMLDVTGMPIGRDFINAWAGAKLMLSGHVMQLFDLDAYQAATSQLFGQKLPPTIWSYPPHLLFFIWPLALMSYSLGLAVWTLATFAAFAWAVLGMVPRQHRSTLLLALMLAPASLVNVLDGQNGFLTAALFLGGFRLVGTRPILAGILFGLLSFKPQLGLLLPFALVVMGAWRTIFAAAATTLLLIAGSIGILGFAPWHAYFTVTAQIERDTLEDFVGFFRLMMPSVYAALRILHVAPLYSVLGQIIVAVPVFIAALLAVGKTSDVAQRVLVIATATFLISPYSFNYDMPALAGAIAWRNFSARPIDGLDSKIYAAAWLIPAMIVPLHLVDLPLSPLVLFGLFALVVRDAFAQREPTHEPLVQAEAAG